jgi:thiamine-monophosphate kinase
MLQEMRRRSGPRGGELEIVERIRRRVGRARGGGVRLGIGDDCALLGVGPGEELAVTTDLSIAGRHFDLKWHPAESIGHRALARGLSDLAAMGARPVAAFLSLGVPHELTVASGRARAWVDRFYDGLLGLADAYNTPLAGGDLAESPVAVADIVLVGVVPAGQALRRAGARPGDQIYVTGSLGGAAAGLAELAASGGWLQGGGSGGRVPAVLRPHLYPQPRVRQGLALRRRGVVSAAIDVSDGLSTDLGHLCAESGVGAVVEAERLPRAEGVSLQQAIDGGEDYELLFTVRAGERAPRSIGGVSIRQIGVITKRKAGQPAVWLATGDSRIPLEAQGWEHFRG